MFSNSRRLLPASSESSKQLQRRITEKVTALCDDPFPPGSKKLKAQPDHFRIRVGDYRVIYRVDGKRVVIVIVRIGIGERFIDE
jgi:mRNA interferase RelE/StbE